MKFYLLFLVAAFAVAGCSASNDRSSMEGSIGIQDARTVLRAANASDLFTSALEQFSSVSQGVIRESVLQEGILSDGTPIVYDRSGTCADGGRFYLLDETVLQNVPTETATYDQCVVESTVINGFLTSSTTVGNGASEASGTIRLEKNETRILVENGSWENIFSFGILEFSAEKYEVDTISYSFKTTNYETKLVPDTPFAILGDPTLNHTFRLVELNGNTVDYGASSNPGFMFNDDFSTVRSGILELSRSGDKLEIMVYDDDLSFYLVNLETSDGSVSTDTQPWSEVDLFIGVVWPL